jgi:hypothetical protein
MSTGAKDPHSLLFPDRQWNRIENNIGFVTRLGDRFQTFFLNINSYICNMEIKPF